MRQGYQHTALAQGSSYASVALVMYAMPDFQLSAQCLKQLLTGELFVQDILPHQNLH